MQAAKATEQRNNLEQSSNGRIETPQHSSRFQKETATDGSGSTCTAGGPASCSKEISAAVRRDGITMCKLTAALSAGQAKSARMPQNSAKHARTNLARGMAGKVATAFGVRRDKV